MSAAANENKKMTDQTLVGQSVILGKSALFLSAADPDCAAIRDHPEYAATIGLRSAMALLMAAVDVAITTNTMDELEALIPQAQEKMALKRAGALKPFGRKPT